MPPGFSRRDHDLVCDGVPLAEIATAAGTPVYVYSAATIRERYRAIDHAFQGYPHALHYALKANSTLAIARLLHALGSGVDANSVWEIETARRAGFDASQIVFTGVGKSPAELECAVALDVKAINVESAGELARVEAIAARLGRVARVAMRLNPDIDAGSHPHISTGLKINKFGVPVADALPLLFQLKHRPHLRLVAVHVHVGSQITSLDPLRNAASFATRIALDLQRDGAPIEYVDLGGGLGVSYDGAEVPSPGAYVAVLLAEVRGSRLPIVLEPGRAIAAPAGALVARVIDVKPRDAGSEFGHRRRHDRAAAAGAVQRLSPDRTGPRRRGRQPPLRDRRSGLREQRRRRPRSGPAAARRRGPGRHPRRRRLRIGDGVELQSSSAAGGSARRQRRMARDPPAPDDRRSAGA